ncbi:MAG: hypothetical protein LBU25_10840 [Treponema sp.]|jgi:hypothetical protein|nr:hypothetical protein [Treponema sp.]
MSKKYILILSYTAISLISVYAAAVPSWYPDPNRVYPKSQYISALGIGSNEREAKAAAMSDIALYFKSSIQVENDLILHYNQVMEGKYLQESRKIEEKNVTRINSMAEFRGIRFTVPWYNETDKEWFIVGYIDKEESLEIWKKRIDVNRMFIDTLIAQGNQQEESLFRYRYIRQAFLLAQIMEADIRACGEIVNSIGQFAEILEFTQRIIAEYHNFRVHLTFDIHIQGDRESGVQLKLGELLEKHGYTVVMQDPRYRIVGEITGYEQTLPAGLFVRIGATLRLINQGGRVLHSFTIPVARKGSRVDWDGAYREGFRYLEDYLEKNTIGELAACIDG